jgi:DNA polymerase-3 subunit alpha
MMVEATLETEQLKLLCRSAQPIDGAIAQSGSIGLKIFVDTDAAIAPIASLLERAANDPKIKTRGPVSLCLLNPELPGEVEMTLGDGFSVNPQVKGAIKSLGGVVMVEEI